MGKNHRDNHKARKKRGSVAFQKKAQRRAPNQYRKKCQGCGTFTRIHKLENGFCPMCYGRIGLPITE